MSSTPDTSASVILTTLGADVDPSALARTLVEERLAACVAILPPMVSVYRWKNAIEQAEERQLIIKTAADRVAALERRVRELHPYEVPEFLVLRVDAGLQSYLEWMLDSTRIVR